MNRSFKTSIFQWVHTLILTRNLGDLCLAPWWTDCWQQCDKKKDDDFVSLLDINTESLFAVGIVLFNAKIISAIASFIPLINNKAHLTHNYSCGGHSESMRLLNQSIWLLSEVGTTRPTTPHNGHISVYMIHIISGCTHNTTHITVSLSDPSKALLKLAPLDKWSPLAPSVPVTTPPNHHLLSIPILYTPTHPHTCIQAPELTRVQSQDKSQRLRPATCT